MTTKKKHIIWTDDFDFDGMKDDLAEDYPDCDDDELWRIAADINAEYLDDERVNLNIQMNRPILVIGDLGLWNGRRSGYKEIRSGNIRDCLYTGASEDYVTWYLDVYGDLCCEAHHHDGTNYYTYRVYKDEATEEQIDKLKEKIYYGKATRADISRVTKRLGDEIAEVYGWELSRFGKQAQLPKPKKNTLTNAKLPEIPETAIRA